MDTCSCGCGTAVVTPGARWTRGHKYRVIRQNDPKFRCECGCGEVVQKADRRYAPGHNPTPYGKPRDPVEYDWSNLSGDLERAGSVSVLSGELGISRYAIDRRIKEQASYVMRPIGGPALVGWLGEEIALRLLPGSTRYSITGKEPWDLNWDGQRVNVKTAKATDSRGSWKFATHRGRENCDLFCLVGVDEHIELVAAWVLPTDEVVCVRDTTLRPTGRSRYDKYRIR